MSSNTPNLPKTLKSFSWSSSINTFLYVLIAVGILSFVLSLQFDVKRAWANFLLNYFMWLSIAFAGVFFAALQHLTGSFWSVTIRRVSESFSAFLPYAFILFIVLLFGMEHLFEWLHHDAVEHDKLLKLKSAYLNQNFFIIRHVALYLVVILLGGWMVKNSIRQDESGDLRLTKLNVKIAAPFMLLFGWLFSFASFDLLMSLFPHWFSTMFGVYAWSGLFYSGLAMLMLWVVKLRQHGYLEGYVTEDHLHDLGKLMFAFLVFWGYIAFSQFMLIWYANMPEETVYYLARAKGGWMTVSYLLMFVKFVIPFFILISRPAKRNPKILTIMSVWFILAQWLDFYWLIYPAFFPNDPVFGWMEVGVFLGFAALFFKVVGHKLGQASVVAVKDPRLQLALHHHQ